MSQILCGTRISAYPSCTYSLSQKKGRKMASNDWNFPHRIEEMYDLAPVGSNLPTAGAQTERELPIGSADIQLYSMATPNGQKIGIMLEELGVEYDAHALSLSKGDQFTSGYVNKVNPNSKIPALLDLRGGGEGKPVRIFESGAILLYLAEKYGKLIPTDINQRTECLNWLFWGTSSFGAALGVLAHYFLHARPDALEARGYGLARYGMEVQRLLSVLDQHLATQTQGYLIGDFGLTIADIISFPLVYALLNGFRHPSGISISELLGVRDKYVHVVAWVDRIHSREAVQRGMQVCNFQGVAKPWLVSAEGK